MEMKWVSGTSGNIHYSFFNNPAHGILSLRAKKKSLMKGRLAFFYTLKNRMITIAIHRKYRHMKTAEQYFKIKKKRLQVKITVLF